MARDLDGLMRTHLCGELRLSHVGGQVSLCGWVHRQRDLGGLFFIDLRDKLGAIQLNFDHYQQDAKTLKQITLESVLQVKGIVRARPENARLKDLETGEVEVEVHELKILSLCENPPFLPEGKIEASEDLRLKYRYLDLRSSRLQKILSLRSELSRKTREALCRFGFTEVETPILYKTTPEGARDYIVPSRVHPGKVYALPQSPQTLKQLLMIGGTDKYFQLARCFRDEDLRADRQPEFTQVDIEVSFGTQNYMKNLAGELISQWFLSGEKADLQVMSYQEVMKKYGSDKPDTRFGLEHQDVTESFKDSSFQTFQEVSLHGGLIKAIYLDASLGDFSRKDIDALTEVVKPFGGKGVAWFKIQGTDLSGGISKFITPNILQKLTGNNGIWFFCADQKHSVVHECANALRLFLGKKLGLMRAGYSFLWVTDFPLLEFNQTDGRFYALHHPFTRPKEEDLIHFLSGKKEDLMKVKAEAYDVVCNGYEIGGGSLRIYDQEVQRKMFEILGLSAKEIDHKFGFFIEALKYGTPPHGGIAFGLDRVVMLAAGTDSIRDVIAFPKTTSATDLMAQAPSAPGEDQLKELHFNWKN